MSAMNQVGYEAVESSSDLVTPDSNNDEPLSLMRYKELQLIAMSLNLPGNLKHKMLVEVIKAKRANREGDVERILAEHRCNRKTLQKRPKSSKAAEDIGYASTNQDVYDGQQPLPESPYDTADSKFERRGEAGGVGGSSDGRAKVHHHRKKHKGNSPRGSEGARTSTQSMPTPPDTPSPYLSRLYGPYAYPMQPKPMSQSVLASYLSTGGPPSSAKNEWRYNSNDVYGVASTIQVATPPTPYAQTESEGYKQIISRHLSASFASPTESERSTHRFSQEEQNYLSLQQQSQMLRGSNFGNTYTNHQLLAYANQASLAYPNLLQSAYASPPLSASQSSSYTSDSPSYTGYQQSTDTSIESSRVGYMKKSILPQGYGQQFLPNQRFGDREHSISNNDDSVQPAVISNHSSVNSNPLTHKEVAHSKAWSNNNVSSTSTASQQNYRKYPMYGNNNNVWHYQGAPLNYNGTAESPSNVAHDLTVPSRRMIQGGILNGVAQSVSESHTSINQGVPLTADHSIQSPVRPPPPPYSQDRSDSFNQPSTLTSKQSMNTSGQFVDYPLNTERNYVDRMASSAYQQTNNNQEEPSSNCDPSRDKHTAVSYPIKEGVESVEETKEVPTESECCPGNSFNMLQSSGNNDTAMTYCHSVCVCPMKNQPSPYPCSENPSSAYSSFYSSLSSPTNQILSSSCSGCDSVRYPQHSMQYQATVNQNVSQSSIAQNNQFSMSQGVNYGYPQSQQIMSYTAMQNYPYSQFSGQANTVELGAGNSPDETSDGYFQEQTNDDNCPVSYTNQNSMESMWSSVRAPSPELDNPLITPSPKGNDLDIQQDPCDSAGVFPDGTELDIGEDQGLSFPNIYDYVMASAGAGDADTGLELQGSKEPSDVGDSPSPGTLHVVEIEEEEVIPEVSDLNEDSLKEDGDHSEEVFEAEESMKDEDPLVICPETEDPLYLPDTSCGVQEQLVSEESLDKSKEVTSPKVALKRKTRLNREKSSQVQANSHLHSRGRKRNYRDLSPVRKVRSKGSIPRDQITCPHGKGDCEWVGRIPGLASHIRSVHEDSVIVGNDTSYTIHVKELNVSHQTTFFQEAGGILYLVAVHWKDSLLFITLQSLPGSGRNGAQPSGSKASLEVLLKNGKSHGWRGRVWGLVAPSVLYSQRRLPLNSASLQERLWSRGDYLAVDPSKVCDPNSKSFRLYVSITPPECSVVSSTSQVATSIKKSPQGSPSGSTESPQTPISPDSCRTNSSGEHSLPAFNESFSTAGNDSLSKLESSVVASEPKPSIDKLKESSNRSKDDPLKPKADESENLTRPSPSTTQ